MNKLCIRRYADTCTHIKWLKFVVFSKKTKSLNYTINKNVTHFVDMIK